MLIQLMRASYAVSRIRSVFIIAQRTDDGKLIEATFEDVDHRRYNVNGKTIVWLVCAVSRVWTILLIIRVIQLFR